MEQKDPLLGTTLEGRYEIESLIGKGSMSAVYKANDLKLNYAVAVKQLMGNPGDEPALQRFRRGAEAASRLAHPNVVRIYAFSVTPEGHPYLVMDLVQGVTLAELLTKQQKLDPDRAVNLCTQICDALEHSHGKSVVHRNLKPSNVMLIGSTEDQIVKVLDFGQAKAVGDKDTFNKLSKKGETLGAPQYMSPEQCTGQTIDGRADVYAIGCILYQMLTGKPVFEGTNAFEVMAKQVNEATPKLADAEPDLKNLEQLEAIIARAVEKKPEHRYQSTGEMRHDLALINEVPLEEWKSRAVALKSPEQFQQPVILASEKKTETTKTRMNYVKPLLVGSAVLMVPVVGLLILALADLQIPQLTTWKLAVQEAILAPDDPRLLKTLTYMTDYYKAQGRYHEAWAFKSKIIKATEKPLPEDMP